MCFFFATVIFTEILLLIDNLKYVLHSFKYGTLECSFVYFLAIPTITCPFVATSSQSQISFTSPALPGFPNNGANLILTYTVRNPPIMGPAVASYIPASQQTHILSNLQFGTNEITVTATDSTTNPPTTASCTFNFIRTGESNKDYYLSQTRFFTLTEILYILRISIIKTIIGKSS